jgi:hypothetical protein
VLEYSQSGIHFTLLSALRNNHFPRMIAVGFMITSTNIIVMNTSIAILMSVMMEAPGMSV